MLIENYPDLDIDVETPVADEQGELFAEKARKLFRQRVRGG